MLCVRLSVGVFWWWKLIEEAGATWFISFCKRGYLCQYLNGWEMPNNTEWTYNNILRKDVVAYCSFPLLLKLIVIWSKSIKFIVLPNNLLTLQPDSCSCVCQVECFSLEMKNICFLRKRLLSQPFKETWSIFKLFLDIFHDVFVDDLLLDSEIISSHCCIFCSD